jgi:hypothetical protein
MEAWTEPAVLASLGVDICQALARVISNLDHHPVYDSATSANRHCKLTTARRSVAYPGQ